MLKATCDFQSSTLGYVSKGDPIEHNDHGRELLSVGLAERVQEPPATKVVEQKPSKSGKPEDGKGYGTKVVTNKGRKTKGKGRVSKRSDSSDG